MTAKIMIFWFIGVTLSIVVQLDTISTAKVEERSGFVTEIPFHDTKDSREENEVPSEAGEEGWSAWSAWSPCSRSCNGGVTYQLRKCEQKIGCEGDASRNKICNMQPCPDATDFRASQCAAYNHVPYRGRLYEWLPYQDPEDPCSLTCHARSYSFVAKLAPSVRDGTRCREGALDMCVDGKCMVVGCDLRLGSSKKVDECGVCGGDGSTCRRPVYVWDKTPFSPCSVSCGGGYQISRPRCLNKANEKEVDERLCDGTVRPVPEIKECNPEKCPPVWVTDSWSPCSASCGGGRQSRQVHCAEIGKDGLRSPVPQEQCIKQKPLTERPCNLVPCPKWISGPWSGCSVTCGKGQKSRSVACRDAKDQHSEDCEIEEMPPTKQPCDSGLVCTPSEDPGTYLFSDIFKGSQEDAPPRTHFWSFPVSVKSPDVSTEPSYVVGEWGPCSASCGQGFRQRSVDCKIFLEFSRTVAKLQDNECPGPRPPNVESCYIEPCSYDLNKQGDRKKTKGHVGIEVTYSWRSNGFTPCSSSCLGGTRESVIQCVRDHDQAVVKATQCDITKKPDAITQMCNDLPCPPKWNISEFTPCSKSCGGGLMTRKVQCLHEVLRGAVNTLVVDHSNCPQPPPREELFCNNFDCPQRWKPGNWSRCSKSCGGGVKTRKIHCIMQKAFGQEVELAPSNCSKLSPPKTQKLCNMKLCPSLDDTIVPSHQSYVQQHPQRRVFLKVGGRASVFAETNIKIRCPSKNINKTGIVWYKNGQKLVSTKRLKVSMKGALRIRKISLKDSDKYTCVSGNSKADIFITVKPLPSIDDERTVESLKPVTETKDKERTSEEKYSHERSRVGQPTDAKNQDAISKNRPKIIHQPKAEVGNNAEDTIEDNRRQYQYKTNLNNNQNSHQDFNNKAKSFSTEDTIVEFSTLGRIPLYIQARQTVKPVIAPAPASTDKPLIKPLDSDELVPHRGSPDFDKNRQKIKTKTYSTSDEKSPNQVIPPRYGDTWKQTYDGAQRAKNKPKEIWDRNDGGALFSDQEELNVGTPHGGKGFPAPPAPSGASSMHGPSHIKNLLMNLPSLGTTRGIHYDQDTEDTMESFDDDDDTMFSHPTKMVANSFVLGKGKAENLEFDWVITEWSACSQTCGGNGFQVRASQCLVRLNNVSKSVDSTLCEDAGLLTPTTIQSCGYDDCPHWETAPWSQCLESQCFTWHTSYEKRAIFCRTGNGTDLPLSNCDEKTRPRRKRECYNSRCRSTWKVSEWSECTAQCNRQGFQSRILQCVWYGSTRPAGNACRDQQRPSVMRPCKGPPCQSNGDNCTDRSSYCSLAKTLHLCRLSRYHLQCCDSCRIRESKG